MFLAAIPSTFTFILQMATSLLATGVRVIFLQSDAILGPLTTSKISSSVKETT